MTLDEAEKLDFAWRCRGCGRTTPAVELPRCSVCGNDDFADRVDVVTVRTLAHNLAWGAALCASFDLGEKLGREVTLDFASLAWFPGCNKAAP